VRTLDEQNRGSFSVAARLARDLKLLLRLAQMTFDYFTRGARVRRAYRSAERRGQTYWLD
jgi:hypothetical protein